MPTPSRLPIVPASFFGIVLGVAGLGGAWRVAHRVWALPAMIGESLLLLAALIWLMLLTLYTAKWIVARSAAITELGHPVQCCFVAMSASVSSPSVRACSRGWQSNRY